MSNPVLPAAVAILSHGEDVLMVQRQPHLHAFAGHWAFPGGKVETEDGPAGSEEALQRALARELEEETGLMLPALLADHAVVDIRKLGTATAPAFVPKRFCSHFFHIRLRQRPVLQLCPHELCGARWAPAGEWLQRWAQGRLLCAPPTLAVLAALADDIEAETAPQLDTLPGSGDADDVPWIEPLGGLRMLPVRSATIPPAQHTNAFWFGGGDTAGVLVDPSPHSEAEYQRLLRTLHGWRVDTVFITHHHRDHSQQAARLAAALGADMAMSADTHARLLKRHGSEGFGDVRVRHLDEGDVLGQWQGEPVRVLAVPGHDAGQLAPMPDSRAWCIVSDLIQGVGTVVVGGEEGDMAQYFASLQRIIDLDPMVVLPSHGPALGGTWRLAETLRHRRQREEQVRTALAAGMDVDQMLAAMYAGTPAFLLPLARVNIEAHIAKLGAEGLAT